MKKKVLKKKFKKRLNHIHLRKSINKENHLTFLKVQKIYRIQTKAIEFSRLVEVLGCLAGGFNEQLVHSLRDQELEAMAV